MFATGSLRAPIKVFIDLARLKDRLCIARNEFSRRNSLLQFVTSNRSPEVIDHVGKDQSSTNPIGYTEVFFSHKWHFVVHMTT